MFFDYLFVFPFLFIMNKSIKYNTIQYNKLAKSISDRNPRASPESEVIIYSRTSDELSREFDPGTDNE